MSNHNRPIKARRKGKRYRVSIPLDLATQAGLSGDVFWVNISLKDKAFVLTPTKEPQKPSEKKDEPKKEATKKASWGLSPLIFEALESSRT